MLTADRRSVVLDVDTGVDDALAILLAIRSEALDVRAITCVAGNVLVDDVVANTLKVLDAAGAGDVPVARGADRPLVNPPRHARHVHGEDGMADLGLPTSGRRPVAGDAVELLRRTISDGPVTLVTLAPLTNIALLFRTYPEVAGGIKRLVLMGGSASGGNATAVAEFNVWHDPEAAAIVFSAGVPITMYGLDVFTAPTVDESTAARLAASPEPATQLAGRLLQHQVRRGSGLGDAGAVASVIDPDGIRTERRPVRVELSGAFTRGQTVVDRRDRFSDLEGPAGDLVDVAIGIDATRYRDLFVNAVSRLDRGP